METRDTNEVWQHSKISKENERNRARGRGWIPLITISSC